eukprot:scaffold1087_cov198-Pinguiococcus_pyrenoidosus.AAC.5
MPPSIKLARSEASHEPIGAHLKLHRPMSSRRRCRIQAVVQGGGHPMLPPYSANCARRNLPSNETYGRSGCSGDRGSQSVAKRFEKPRNQRILRAFADLRVCQRRFPPFLLRTRLFLAIATNVWQRHREPNQGACGRPQIRGGYAASLHQECPRPAAPAQARSCGLRGLSPGDSGPSRFVPRWQEQPASLVEAVWSRILFLICVVGTSLGYDLLPAALVHTVAEFYGCSLEHVSTAKGAQARRGEMAGKLRRILTTWRSAGHRKRITRMALSPDGQKVATAR